MLPLRFWLAGLLFLAAVGPALPLLAQGLPPEQVAPPKQPPLREVYQDFRGGKPLLPFLKPDGPDFDAMTRPEERGLRITLPAMRPNHYPVGVVLTFPLSGDFEITGSYELLSADRPAKGYGVGVTLSVATDPGRRKFGKVARLMLPKAGSAYAAEFWNNDLPKPDNYVFPPPKATEVQAGQLRLVREGSMVRCLVAEGSAKEFRPIFQWPLGADDLETVHFTVTDSGSPGNRVDARLVDLRIRSSGPIPEAAPEAAPPSDQQQPAGSRVWLVLAVLLGLLLSGALGVGLYLRSRRQAAATPDDDALADQNAKSDVAVTSVSFPCAGCGKNLKVRATLAGKKVKCPQCGQAVRVP